MARPTSPVSWVESGRVSRPFPRKSGQARIPALNSSYFRTGKNHSSSNPSCSPGQIRTGKKSHFPRANLARITALPCFLGKPGRAKTTTACFPGQEKSQLAQPVLFLGRSARGKNHRSSNPLLSISGQGCKTIELG